MELIKLFIDIFPFANSNSPFFQLIDIMHEHQFIRRLSASISISAVNGLIEGRAIKRYSEIFLGLQCFGNRWGYGGQPKTLLPGFILHLSLSSEKQIGRIIIMKSLTLAKNVYAMSLSCFHFFNVCSFIDCSYFEGRTTLTNVTNYCKSVSRDSI